jgi:DNA-binding transcriptional regulator GbsR (MarR family)
MNADRRLRHPAGANRTAPPPTRWTSPPAPISVQSVLNVMNHRTAPHPPVHPKARQFVERVGMLTETEGLPRIAGRIYGLLLMTPGECSLDEMADSLGVSKASISTDARRLEDAGIVVRSSRPGDRRDYYAIAPDALRQSLERKLRGLRQFREILQDARTIPGAAEVRDRLDEWDAWYEDAVEVLTLLLEKTARGRARKRPTTRS